MEKTLILLKPDAVQRGLCGAIVSRLEQKGLKIVAAKMFRFTPALAKEHYAHLAAKPFYPKLEEFMCSSPVIGLVAEGKDAVNQVRGMCGATDSGKALAGTIRGDLGMSTQCNLIHASDSREAADAEIRRFFKPDEIMAYARPHEGFVHARDEQ